MGRSSNARRRDRQRSNRRLRAEAAQQIRIELDSAKLRYRQRLAELKAEFSPKAISNLIVQSAIRRTQRLRRLMAILGCEDNPELFHSVHQRSLFGVRRPIRYRPPGMVHFVNREGTVPIQSGSRRLRIRIVGSDPTIAYLRGITQAQGYSMGVHHDGWEYDAISCSWFRVLTSV